MMDGSIAQPDLQIVDRVLIPHTLPVRSFAAPALFFECMRAVCSGAVTALNTTALSVVALNVTGWRLRPRLAMGLRRVQPGS